MIGSSLPPLEITPPGRVMLFSRSACDTWNSDTPFSDAFSRSTDTSALRSTSPDTSTPNTPSTADISGTIRDSTMRCSSATLRLCSASLRAGSRPPSITLSCSTGNSSGLMRATIGSLTPLGNATPLTLELTTFSALAMSVPNSNDARMIDRFSVEIDCIVSRPSTPEIAFSMGAVTSRATASGFADG